MGMLDPVLLGLISSVLAVNAIAVVVILPRIRRAMERSQREVGGIAAALERSLGAIRTVKASGAEMREISSVRRTARRAWQRGVEAARWTAVMDASAGLAVQASFLAVLGVGGARVASGQLPVSSLIAFLLYVVLLSEPLTALVSGVGQLQAGLAAVLRISELHAAPTEDLAGERQAARGPSRPASITFSRVWFRYPGDDDRPWVLRDLGGERQRISIARALLRRPRILLLDEATSQLDAANELALRELVSDVARATTVLVVAHRLSSVVNAERILVLDRGRIRAAGTHEQLLDRDPLYRELASTQLLAPRQPSRGLCPARPARM